MNILKENAMVDQRKIKIELGRPNLDFDALRVGDKSLLNLKVTGKINPPIDNSEGKVALVCGATGFLGVNFIKALMDSAQYSHVYCFVRQKNGLSGIERLKSCMKKYFCFTKKIEQKVTCLSSPYGAANFGLTDEEYINLSNKVDTVFNFVSDTDYTRPYEEVRSDYVLKNLELLEFCANGLPKRIHYVGSTISFLFTEKKDFARPDTWWFSGYSKMKWVNRRIYENAFTHGIQGAVYLPPYITGRTDIAIDPGHVYSYWRMIVEIMRIKKIWDGEFFQAIPVDILCSIILKNSLLEKPCAQVIPTLPTIHSRDLAKILGCEIVSWDDFKKHARAGFKESEIIMTQELGDGILERANKSAEGFDASMLECIPSYVELIQQGLNQDKLRVMVQGVTA